MSKTIKQVADEIGVSKTAIRKYMDDAFKAAYTSQDGEKSPVMISDDGVEVLKSKCKGRNPENQVVETTENQVETSANHAENDVIEVLKKELATLNKQLEVKDEQLKAKDQQIKELTEANKNLTESNTNITKSLQAAQALHAADSKLLLEAKSRKSFWSRFFKKKDTVTDAESA